MINENKVESQGAVIRSNTVYPDRKMGSHKYTKIYVLTAKSFSW